MVWCVMWYGRLSVILVCWFCLFFGVSVIWYLLCWVCCGGCGVLSGCVLRCCDEWDIVFCCVGFGGFVVFG